MPLDERTRITLGEWDGGVELFYGGRERGVETDAAAPAVHRPGGIGQQEARHRHAPRPDRQRGGEPPREFPDGGLGGADRSGADGNRGRPCAPCAAGGLEQVLPVAGHRAPPGKPDDVLGARRQQRARLWRPPGRKLTVQRRAEHPRPYAVGEPARPEDERIAEIADEEGAVHDSSLRLAGFREQWHN